MVKFAAYGSLTVNGTLVADGTAGRRFILPRSKTTRWAATPTATAAGSPARGDWRYLNFAAGSIDNVLDNVVVRYGGDYGIAGSYVSVYIATASITVQNSLIEEGYGHGIYLNAVDVSIDNSIIRNNRLSGIYVNNSTATITNNTISNNDQNGIYCSNDANPTIGGSEQNANTFYGNTSYAVFNASTTVIDATYNYWGDPSGPYHETDNPDALGNAVSDYVDFEPWLEENPLDDAPTIINGPIPDQSQAEDAPPWTLDLSAYESDAEDSGTDLDWSVSGVDGALFTAVITDSDNDILTFTPVAGASGSDVITLTLTDSGGQQATQDITVTLTAVNDAPTIINGPIPDQSQAEDAPPWTLDLSAYESDAEDSGTDLDWSVSGVDGALFTALITDSDNDILTFTPVAGASGSDVITLTLTDSGGQQATQDITVTLTAVNDAPTIINGPIPDQSRDEDAPPWTLDLSAYESDAEDSGTALDWSVSGVDGALFTAVITDSDNDILTFTPVAGASGSDDDHLNADRLRRAAGHPGYHGHAHGAQRCTDDTRNDSRSNPG